MFHLFPGFSGLAVSLLLFSLLWVLLRSLKKHETYNLGPGGDPRNYEPIMARYLRLAEFMIGAASGSIVLIVGSSALHGRGGRLPWFFASPLILVAFCVVYGVSFMALQVVTFENCMHGEDHTANGYAFNETLGYSALACFLIGYIWLILAATNM